MMKQQGVRAKGALKDEDTYPEGTIVRQKDTGVFARIVQRSFLRQKEQRHFLGYEAEIEGKEGIYCIHHNDVELEVLPIGYQLVMDEDGELVPRKVDQQGIT